MLIDHLCSKRRVIYTVSHAMYIQLIFLSHPPPSRHVDKFQLINPKYNIFCRGILFYFHGSVEMLSIN